jgi:hypothetical protein
MIKERYAKLLHKVGKNNQPIFMVVPCINDIIFFIVQLMHTISAQFTTNTHNSPETTNLILAKYCLWLPVDGLYKPKHVGATVIILNVLIIHILI